MLAASPVPVDRFSPAFLGPSSMFASRCNIIWNAGFLARDSQRQTLAFYRHKEGCPLIVVLGFKNCPNAVILIITPTVIDALDAMRGRRLGAHIGQETCEIVTPLSTNSDPSTAIMWIVWAVPIIASIFHSGPRPIFGRPRSVFGGSVFGHACQLRTSASGCVATLHAGRFDNAFIPAIAPTMPERTAPAQNMREAKHDQPAISTPSQVLIYTFGSHRVLRQGSRVRSGEGDCTLSSFRTLTQNEPSD